MYPPFTKIHDNIGLTKILFWLFGLFILTLEEVD